MAVLGLYLCGSVSARHEQSVLVPPDTSIFRVLDDQGTNIPSPFLCSCRLNLNAAAGILNKVVAFAISHYRLKGKICLKTKHRADTGGNGYNV